MAPILEVPVVLLAARSAVASQAEQVAQLVEVATRAVKPELEAHLVRAALLEAMSRAERVARLAMTLMPRARIAIRKMAMPLLMTTRTLRAMMPVTSRATTRAPRARTRTLNTTQRLLVMARALRRRLTADAPALHHTRPATPTATRSTGRLPEAQLTPLLLLLLPLPFCTREPPTRSSSPGRSLLASVWFWL